MTESEWLASTDPAQMLQRMGVQQRHISETQKISDRKLRLWIFADVRHRISKRVPDEKDKRRLRIIEAGERMVDGLGTEAEALAISNEGVEASARTSRFDTAANDAAANARDAQAYGPDGCAASASILRCVAGNPFRPVALPKVRPPHMSVWRCPWLTPAVVSLGQAAYESRLPDGSLDPARMGILSDALEEAGCPPFMDGEKWVEADVEIAGVPIRMPVCVKPKHPLLAHLRSPGPHWRGCHALDLVLGLD